MTNAQRYGGRDELLRISDEELEQRTADMLHNALHQRHINTNTNTTPTTTFVPNADRVPRKYRATSQPASDVDTPPATKRKPPAKPARPEGAIESVRFPEQIARDKVRFLEVLQATGSVAKACTIIQRPRNTVIRWRNTDAVFAQAWQDIWETRVDELEAAVLERAINGYEEPVFQMGECVGSKTVHHPGLQTFMLSKLRPETYGAKADQKTQTTPQQQAEMARAFMQAMAGLHQEATPAEASPTPLPLPASSSPAPGEGVSTTDAADEEPD